jgi:putative NADH-flavin reductase
MRQQNSIAVLGGGGRTGKFVVSQLLNQGYHLKLLLRSPELFHLQSDHIKVIKGDAIDPEVICSLVKECKAVVNTVGQRNDEPLVASQATINILNAMSEHGVERYILVAGLNVDTPFDKKSDQTKAATEWMKTSFPLIHEDRQKTYSLLTASKVNWTLVRVPFIEFTDVRCEIAASTEDCRGNKISAASIAAFISEQLWKDTYCKQAPFIANV